MDNLENKQHENAPTPIQPNDTVAEPTSNPIVPSQVAQPAKKKRSTLAITTAFLAGAMTYAIFVAGYNIYMYQNAPVASSDETEQIAAPSTIQNKEYESIEQEDLDKYVEATDCTSKAAYSAYQIMIVKADLSDIDLYDGGHAVVITGNSSRNYRLGWKNPPEAVNYKCEKISISEITSEDRVTVYADKGAVVASPAYIEEVRVIQKANK